jgi:conjugative transfer signal peptidase TraF
VKTRIEKLAIAAAISSAAVLALGGLCGALGLRINSSRSIPLGIYATSDRPVVSGAYVLLCPPENAAIAEAKRRGYLAAGFCPGDYGYMMKMVFAVAGDAVAIKTGGVSVNGVKLPFSAPLVSDAAGRPLPRYGPATFVLGPSEVLLMSNVSGTSFDGRYFGPVERSHIKTVIVPVFTW